MISSYYLRKALHKRWVNMMNLVLKTRNCVSKMRNCVLKMMNFAAWRQMAARCPWVWFRTNGGGQWLRVRSGGAQAILLCSCPTTTRSISRDVSERGCLSWPAWVPGQFSIEESSSTIEESSHSSHCSSHQMKPFNLWWLHLMYQIHRPQLRHGRGLLHRPQHPHRSNPRVALQLYDNACRQRYNTRLAMVCTHVEPYALRTLTWIICTHVDLPLVSNWSDNCRYCELQHKWPTNFGVFHWKCRDNVENPPEKCDFQ